MAKFNAEMQDLVVATDNGFITFKDGLYATTNKKEIESLRKAKDVKEIKAPAKPKNIADVNMPIQ